jgi:hypothetical protein
MSVHRNVLSTQAQLKRLSPDREQLTAAREVAAEVARIKAINADLEARNALLEQQTRRCAGPFTGNARNAPAS